MICYLLQSAVDWPGIRTCIITCMIVGLTSEGATIQKGTLRIAGALAGGALGFLAIMLVIPGAESITSLALLVAAGSAVAAWVYVGSARISYAGVQVAFAFFVCVIQGFAPSWYFYTIRDRMIGILLGNAVISFVFLSVWPVRAGAAMWASLGSALRAMADLARVGSRSDDQAVVAREVQGLRELAYRHFATAQQSAEEEAFEWSASRPEMDAARDRFQAATTEAQVVFLTQLAIASQRPNVAPAELSESLVVGARRFDAAVAESLDVDRRSGAGRRVSRPSGPARASRGLNRPHASRDPADREPGSRGPGRRSAGVVSRAGAAPRAPGVRGLQRVIRSERPRDERGTELPFLLAPIACLLLAACAAYAPLANAPPSADRPWKGPGLESASGVLRVANQAERRERVSIDSQKTYELTELIDIAQRTNPETRVAWERARQAAIAAGLAEGTYYPRLAAAATAAIASVPLPIPETVVPGGVFRADTHFVIPALNLEWLLLDFGRRRAAVDAAQALIVEANAGFNAKHQQVVFNVTRDFYALTAARGKLNADRAALDSARSLQESVTARKSRGLATQPEVLQAEEEAARATYELEDAMATEHDTRMTLLESVGIAPYTPIEIVDASQRPLPPELTETVDEAIDRALTQRPDLIALLAGVQAQEAAVREARAQYWPRLAVRSEVGGNIGELSVENSPYQGVSDLQYGAGLRFELDLFEGFERRNKLKLAESRQKEAEDELEHAKEKAVRQVWTAYDDAKVALSKQRAAAALLAASEKAWAATFESYRHGLATFPTCASRSAASPVPARSSRRPARKRGREPRRLPSVPAIWQNHELCPHQPPGHQPGHGGHWACAGRGSRSTRWMIARR